MRELGIGLAWAVGWTWLPGKQRPFSEVPRDCIDITIVDGAFPIKCSVMMRCYAMPSHPMLTAGQSWGRLGEEFLSRFKGTRPVVICMMQRYFFVGAGETGTKLQLRQQLVLEFTDDGEGSLRAISSSNRQLEALG